MKINKTKLSLHEFSREIHYLELNIKRKSSINNRYNDPSIPINNNITYNKKINDSLNNDNKYKIHKIPSSKLKIQRIRKKRHLRFNKSHFIMPLKIKTTFKKV